MAVFEYSSRVPAPFGRVWEFHSTIDGLRRLTPGWANLRVEELRLPADATDEVLVEGSEIDLSVGPLPFGPRQHWTSVITERVEDESRAYFVDEMRDGPLAEWRHRHLFEAAGATTIVTDRIAYRTPLGQVADRAFHGALRLGFRYRHRETREIVGQA